MANRGEIRKFILENFIFDGTVELADEDSLLEKGIIDSTGVLELVAFLEEKYDLKVEDEELIPENLDSIRKIAAFIDRRLQGRMEKRSTSDVGPALFGEQLSRISPEDGPGIPREQMVLSGD